MAGSGVRFQTADKSLVIIIIILKKLIKHIKPTSDFLILLISLSTNPSFLISMKMCYM